MEKEEDDGISFRPWKGEPSIFQPALDWTDAKLREAYKKFQLHAPTDGDRFCMCRAPFFFQFLNWPELF